MTGWAAAQLDELDRFATGWGGVWRPVRRRFDVRAFGVNAWTGENAGDHVIERHREPDGPEELYAVLEGHATFTIDGESVDAPRGTFVFVPPNTVREAVAVDPGTTVLAVGAPCGDAFEPSAWEEWAVADAHRRAGDLERARGVMRDLVERSPDVWQAHYNRACFESVAGDADEALASLRRAVELEPGEVRRVAPKDPDFDPIRNDPRYTEVIG
jgi:quercetin dioxygenase-like cupin family protein